MRGLHTHINQIPKLLLFLPAYFNSNHTLKKAKQEKLVIAFSYVCRVCVCPSRKVLWFTNTLHIEDKDSDIWFMIFMRIRRDYWNLKNFQTWHYTNENKKATINKKLVLSKDLGSIWELFSIFRNKKHRKHIW